MADADELMQRGADAYAAGDFAGAQAAWEAAAAAGHDGALDALRLLAHGDARRQVLWGRMAERDNPSALWSLGIAAVERVDLPAVREHWARAAELDEQHARQDARERHLSELEAELARIEAAFAAPDYFMQAGRGQLERDSARREQVQRRLGEAIGEWEAAAAELETLAPV